MEGGATGGGGGAGEQLCSRLELPPGVTGVESCRSAMSSPMDSYIGDSCGSFEFLPKELPPRRTRGHTEDSGSPPRDIKKEIEKRASEHSQWRLGDGGSLNNKRALEESELPRHEEPVELRAHLPQQDTVDSAGSRRSSGSDRRSSGGRSARSSGSDRRGRHRKNSHSSSAAGEKEKSLSKVGGGETGSEHGGGGAGAPLPGLAESQREGEAAAANCDKAGGPVRPVGAEVLVNMAKDIRPPPLGDSSSREDFRSPRAKAKAGGGGSRAGKGGESGGTKGGQQAYGPMPNFEREIQRILAEQVPFRCKKKIKQSDLCCTGNRIRMVCCIIDLAFEYHIEKIHHF